MTILLFSSKLALAQSQEEQIAGLKAKIESKETPYQDLDSLYCMLAKLYRRVNPDEHYKNAHRSIELAQETRDIKREGIALTELGKFYNYKGLYDSSTYFYALASEKFGEIGREDNVYGIKFTIAKNHRVQGNLIEAESNMLEVISYARSQQDTLFEFQANAALAQVYAIKEDFEKALTYFRRNQRLFYDREMQSITYQNLGTIFGDMKQIDSCVYYTQKAIELKEGVVPESSLYKSYNNLGAILLLDKNPKEALYWFHKCRSVLHNLEDDKMLHEVTMNLGRTHMILNNLAQAEEYLNESFSLSSKHQDFELQRNAAKSLRNLYTELGRYRKALEFSNIYSKFQDSINNEEKNFLSEEMHAKFEVERFKFEKNVADLEVVSSMQKVKLSRTISFVSIISLFLFSLIGYLIFLRFRSKKQNELLQVKLEESLKNINLEKQMHKAELKAIQSQMNPHFIFNALNSIQEYILLKKPDQAVEYLGEFSDLTRMYLKFSSEGSLSISDEVKSLTKYLKLEKLRLGEDFAFNIEGDFDLNSNRIKIPNMLIQPYVENAIKHGLRSKEGRKKIDILFEKNDDEKVLKCIVIDNGIGREKSASINTKKHASFSTSANAERVSILASIENKDSNIHVEDLYKDGMPAGTKVTIKTPYRIE